MDEALKDRKDLINAKDKQGNKIFTTQKALDEETKIRDTARKGRKKFKPLNPDYTIKNDKLTPEQANAVQHVLKSKDFITIVSGGAGTGKTWSIKEVAEGVKEKNINFGAFAPSTTASREVQRADGFKDATTIKSLLDNQKLQDSVKNGVMWIDEAGLVGNQDMNSLMDIAKKQNARLLLTGDIKQHNSVQRGDALKIIQKYGSVKPASINKIQRQKVSAYRKAVEWVSKGKMEKGLNELDKMGAIKESKDFNELKSNIANEYISSVKDKKETLLVATTHGQGKAVTDEIREKMKNEGLLSKEKRIIRHERLGYSDEQKKDAVNYEKNMVVKFHKRC